MHLFSQRRRRQQTPFLPADAVPAHPPADEAGWISFVGQGSGFHDCPLCRELASQGEPVPAVVAIRPESLPLLTRTGWLDDLVDLVGPNATVRVMGPDLDAEPVEAISMATFLARLGYDE